MSFIEERNMSLENEIFFLVLEWIAFYITCGLVVGHVYVSTSTKQEQKRFKNDRWMDIFLAVALWPLVVGIIWPLEIILKILLDEKKRRKK